VLVAMGVPLGQGYALGRPATPWSTVPSAAAARIRLATSRRDTGGTTIERVLEERPVVAEGSPLRATKLFTVDPELDVAVVVTEEGLRPTGLVTREQTLRGEPAWPATIVQRSSECGSVLRRAMARPRPVRFHPLVCCDELGRYLGIVSIERLVEQVA